MATTAEKPKPRAATAATTTAGAVATANALRAYQIEKTDPDSGEVIIGSKFRYLPGHPRQIRCDLKAGVFNIGGEKVIGKSITIIPVTWRKFEDNILNMGRKTWLEVFFFDEGNNLCAVLFHGYSVENFGKLYETLYYDLAEGETLANVKLTIWTEKQVSKKEAGGSYYIAFFKVEGFATPQEVQERAEFAADHLIYRVDTQTGEANVHLSHGYRLPDGYEPDRRALPATTRDEADPSSYADGADQDSRTR